MEAGIQKITDVVRAFMQQQAAPFVNRLFAGRLSPDMVTLISLAGHVPVALLIAAHHNLWAAILLIVFGLLDSLDGALARVQKITRPHGMLLDSTTDLIKQILLYVGAAYAFISGSGSPYMAVWAVAACGCSLLTGYVSARGDAIMAGYKTSGHAANKAFRGGLFQYQVRMFILVVGLLINQLGPAVILITVGAAYTAVDRLFRALGRFGEGTDVQD